MFKKKKTVLCTRLVEFLINLFWELLYSVSALPSFYAYYIACPCLMFLAGKKKTLKKLQTYNDRGWHISIIVR